MHQPTTVVLWEVWRRYRGVLMASPVYFLALSTLSYAVSDRVIFGLELFVHEHAVFAVLLFLASPLVVGLLPLFVYACGADSAGKESTFPTRWFTLPLTTRALVAWPMIYGTVAIALAWLAVACFVLRPGGMDLPLWWPAAALAVGLAWLQAMMWRPFGLPGLRIVVTILVMSVLITVFGVFVICDAPPWGLSILLVCGIAPAYPVALNGVARARRGDQPDWRWFVAVAGTVAGWFSWRGRSFGSPSRAQVWFEWRRNGLGLPILVGLMILFLATLITVNRHIPGLSPHSPLRSPILLLAIPLLGAAIVGGGWGHCGDARRGTAIPAFLATRPMTCAGLIWAKMKAAAIGAAVVWAMTLAAVVLMVLLTGSWAELAGQWSLLTKDFSAAQKAAITTLGVVLLLAGTLKPMIANLFLGLAGRNWIWTVGTIVMGSAVMTIIPLGCWISMWPQYHRDLWAALPWLLASVAVLKLALAGWSLRAVHRRELVETRLMARLLGVWLLIAVSLIAWIVWLVPARFAEPHLVIPCVVLMLPLVRISLAPLALAFNRHR